MAATSRPSTLGERVTSAMFWNSALLPVKTALTFISSVVVVRALSQGDYAIFTAVIALLNTVGLFSDLGVENSIQKYLPEVEHRFGRPGVVRFVLVLLGFKFALLAAISGWLYYSWASLSASMEFGGDAAGFYLPVLLLLFLGVLSDFALKFLISYFRQRESNSLDILFAIVQPVLVILFVWAGGGIQGVLYARMLATLAYVVVGFYFGLRTLRQLPIQPEGRGRWPEVWGRFTRLSAISYFTNLISYFSDISFVVFVLTFYGDTLGIALFGVAMGRVLAPIRQFLVSSLSGVPFPLFARLYVKKDLDKLQDAYASLTRFLTLALLPTAVGLSLLTPNLIRLLFQSRYEPAAPATIILVITLFGESLFHPAQLVLLAFEENRTFTIARLITLGCIPLLFLYVPSMGATGAAFAIGLMRLLSRLYATIMVERKFHLTFPSRFFGKVGAATLIMAAVMLPALGLERPHDSTEAAVRTALALVLGSLAFLIAFKRLGSIEPADRQRLDTLRIPFKRYLLAFL